MYNESAISALLRQQGKLPQEGPEAPGLRLCLSGDRLLLSGSPGTLIELADLLVSLALSPQPGSHWHIDELTLMEESSPIPELILLRDDREKADEHEE